MTINEYLAVAFAFSALFVGAKLLMPLVRAFAKRVEARGQPAGISSADVGARLERMEQAIDAVAIEVERISEGQRFATKLLSERARAHADRTE